MYFSTKSERDAFELQPPQQTNPLYPTFTQLDFTAANEKQFIEYAGPRNEVIINTFRYLMFKVKKGIYVRFQNHKLACFLPFSNAHYVNDWAAQIQGKLPPDARPDVSEWYANNGLLRYEEPYAEHDTNVQVIKDMMQELAEFAPVPDTEFFINRRDYPVLNKDRTEPYFHIWDRFDQPLVSLNFEKFAPILSMCIHERNEDVLIPSYQDWARANPDRFYPRATMDFDTLGQLVTDWMEKKDSRAVWRGSSTGPYVDPKRNQRLALCLLTNGIPGIYDVGLTKWNTRPRKIMGEAKLQYIEPTELIPLMAPKSMVEQSKHRFLLHVDGHTAANRLGHELLYGSVILKIDSPFEWRTWVTDRPNLPFISVQSDLSDLHVILNEIKEDEARCRLLARASRELGLELSCRHTILESLLHTVKKLPNYAPPMPFAGTIISLREARGDAGNLPTICRARGFELYKAVVKVLSEEGVPLENREGVVVREFCGVKFIWKEQASNREVSYGLRYVNPLALHVPNFTFTYGRAGRYVLKEYIEGPTFFDWMKSEAFQFADAMRFLIHTIIALNYLHEKARVVHGDAVCWNIVLHPMGKFVKTDYGGGRCVLSNICPVLIDYERMREISRPADRVNDWLMILMTTLSTILNTHRLQPGELSQVFGILEGFAGTRYCPHKLQSVKDLKRFVRRSAHFNNLATAPKHELEGWTCEDILSHITNVVKIKHYK